MKFDGTRLGSVLLKKDAESIADLVTNLALCDGASVSKRIKNRLGRVSYEETFPRSADPPSPG